MSGKKNVIICTFDYYLVLKWKYVLREAASIIVQKKKSKPPKEKKEAAQY